MLPALPSDYYFLRTVVATYTYRLSLFTDLKLAQCNSYLSKLYYDKLIEKERKRSEQEVAETLSGLKMLMLTLAVLINPNL